jgi:hypothetical protein
MTTPHRALGLGGSIVAATAALVLVGASAASAHHCYKDEWQAAAYEHHAAGGTAWVPLSDLGAQFLIPPDLLEECGYVADDAVATWMEYAGVEQEPLIHSKAVVGSGAMQNGKEPKPFSYLMEEDFVMLTMEIEAGLAACTGA